MNMQDKRNNAVACAIDILERALDDEQSPNHALEAARKDIQAAIYPEEDSINYFPSLEALRAFLTVLDYAPLAFKRRGYGYDQARGLILEYDGLREEINALEAS